jgi:ribosomal protein S19
LEVNKNIELTLKYLYREKENHEYIVRKNNITCKDKIGLIVDKHIKYLQEQNKKRKSIRIWNPNLSINKNCIGNSFEIFNGKTFTKLNIKKEMVGNFFGEYIFTRKLGKQKKKK